MDNEQQNSDAGEADSSFGDQVGSDRFVELEQFEILEKIGAGGMGAVYSARHKTLDKIVALKLLATDRTDAAMVRLHNEAKTLSKLRNKFIAEVYDFGVSSRGEPFMAIEFINGPTLKQMIEERGAMPLSEVTVMAIEICQALEHAHQKGIVHRDIKPGNVIFEINDKGTLRPKVVDFGLAKSIDQVSEITRTGRMLGTPLYISPEQSFGKEVTAQSDMYSLGCVIYHCLTGRPPFRGDTIIDTIRMQREEKAPSLLEQFPKDEHTPELIEMSKIIERMLTKHPAQRFKSMREVELQLEQILDTKQTEEAPHEVSPQESKSASLTEKASNKTVIIIALCALVPLSIFIFAQLSSTYDVPAGSTTKVRAPNLATAIDESAIESRTLADGGTAVSQGNSSSFPTSSTKQDPVGPVLDGSLDRHATIDQLKRLIKEGAIVFYFRNSFLKDEDLTVFENYENARYVNLRNVKISEAGLKHLHRNKIQRLDISETLVTTLQDLPCKSDLVALHVNNNRISDKAIESLKDCSNLQWLECNGTYISPEAVKKLSNVPLQYLWCDKWKRADIAGLEETFPHCMFNGHISYMVRRSDDANAMLQKGKAEDALKLFSGLMQQGKAQKNPTKEIEAMIGIADVLLFLNRREEAFQMYKKAMARGDETQSRWALLFAYQKYMQNGSELYLATPASNRFLVNVVGRFVELLDKYEPNVFKHYEALDQLGARMLRRNQSKLAEMLFQKSLAVQRNIRSEARLIYSLSIDDSKATEKIRKQWQDEDQVAAAATTVELARAMGLQRKSKRAREFFHKGIASLEAATDPTKNNSGDVSPKALNHLMVAYLFGAQSESQTGDAKKAIEYIRKCESLINAHHLKPPPEFFEERQRVIQSASR